MVSKLPGKEKDGSFFTAWVLLSVIAVGYKSRGHRGHRGQTSYLRGQLEGRCYLKEDSV